ncbi:MAG: hypothetical protein JXA67_21600, partial [Micromonosporaceae bacterium]|nr:hypothetical protein [Micromonosporaceae bacterium]
VNLDKQPNEVWRWLTKGPSDLIAPAVATLPDTVKLKGNVVTEHNDDGTVLVIDLNSEAAGQQLQPVVNQFRWSMGPNGLPVELRIEGVRKEVEGQSDQYLRFNPAVWPEGQMEPEKLFIVGGRIQPAKTTAGPPFQILAGEENQDVITAALARQSTQQRLAFVRDDGDGRQRLWLGQLVGQSTARAPTYLRTDIVGTSLSRPVWLTGDIPRVLLSVDGKLVCVTADGQRSSVVSEPGVPTTVTAIAAAPDGRRLAIVGGGEAGIVPLRVDGDTLSLRGFFPLVTGLAEDKVIGWSRQDTVLVGGTGAEGSPLVEVSVDGTWREPTERSGLDGLVVTSLVVYPDDPSQNGERVLAMFEAGQRAYNVFGQQVEQLLVDSGQQASPSGEAESPDGADPEAVPRAPLFYESI